MKNLKKIITVIILIFIFIGTNSKALEPDSDYLYEGIDVSNWQGYIDFEKVKESGIDIVYIETTVGLDYKNPYFELDYENAKLNGLKVGVYHYVMARSITEARQEARFFSSCISGKNIDCKLAMDFEEFGNLSEEEINEISIAFLEEVEKITGKETIVYSDLYNSQNTFKLSNHFPLWIAYYGTESELLNYNTNWNKWEGRQYTDIGVVAGIQEDVDRDIFTQEILLDDNSEIKEIKSEIVEKNQSNRIEYTVKIGDTLWQLSQSYNTSVLEIANLNNIINPNLIYVGEKLTIITNTNFEKIGATGKRFYTVKRGDTLYDLAIKYNTTIESLVKMNQIQNPNLIYIGQRLVI